MAAHFAAVVHTGAIIIACRFSGRIVSSFTGEKQMQVQNKLCDRDQLDSKFIDTSDPFLHTLYLGMAGGSDRLYANIDRVMPGGRSCKFHSHSLQEEFFIVLKGQGIVRIGDEEHAVKAGDFFCKPAGCGIAHQFINTSDEVLELLDVGILDADDVINYPDENVTYEKRTKKVLKGGQLISGWTTNPNCSGPSTDSIG